MPLVPFDKDKLAAATEHLIAEFAKTYDAIGRSITYWQYVEWALFKVFLQVSRCPVEPIASAIFYSPRDFSGKLTLTHNAARLSLEKQPTLLEDWTPLRKRMIDDSEIRNALAHFHLVISIGHTDDYVPQPL